MTNFPPETYLAAARIVEPWANPPWEIYNGRVVQPPNWHERKNGKVHGMIFLPETYHYRALREALDKEYGVMIWWNRINQEWLSDCDRHDIPIRGLEDEDITNLMLRLVQALIEAGVVE